MGSHSVTCHPTQVHNALLHSPSHNQAGTVLVVCVSAVLISAAKVMRCIHCCLVYYVAVLLAALRVLPARLSVCLSRTGRNVDKPELAQTFPGVRINAVSIFRRKGQKSRSPDVENHKKTDVMFTYRRPFERRRVGSGAE